MQLRGYQKKILQDVDDAIAEGHRAVLVVSPVGSGKAVILAALVKQAFDKGQRVLVLAGRVELISQARKQCLAMGIPEREIGVQCGNLAGRRDAGSVQICSVQTLIARVVPNADLVICDECKHSAANSYVEVIKKNPNATIIGFDATPIRYDSKGLGDIFTKLVLGPSVKELVDAGYLASSVVHRGKKDLDLSDVRTRLGDYVSSDLEREMDRQEITGDAVSLWQAHAPGLRTICFAVSVKHSLLLRDAFMAAGIPAAHLDAKTPSHERRLIISDLASGKLLVVSNVFVLSEGVDVPSVKCIIVANPTRSIAVHVQCLGRSGRIDPSNPSVKAVILDLAGNCLRHGLPDHDHVWALETSKPKGNGEAPVKRCGKEDCSIMSATAARFCECGEPFYPRCPRCKPRYDKKTGEKLEGCDKCNGTTPCDPKNPPPDIRCGCCGTLFIPYRDVSIVSGIATEVVTPAVIELVRVQKDPPTAPQLAALKRLGVSTDGLTRTAASKAISDAVTAKQDGKPTLKQAYLLRGHGLYRDDMTFREASLAIANLKSGNRYPTSKAAVFVPSFLRAR